MNSLFGDKKTRGYCVLQSYGPLAEHKELQYFQILKLINFYHGSGVKGLLALFFPG